MRIIIKAPVELKEYFEKKYFQYESSVGCTTISETSAFILEASYSPAIEDDVNNYEEMINILNDEPYLIEAMDEYLRDNDIDMGTTMFIDGDDSSVSIEVYLSPISASDCEEHRTY